MRKCFGISFLWFLVVLGNVDYRECRAADAESNGMELIQAHVIFRHGERTTYSFYPKDPFVNMTFYPVGLGGLTPNGKMGEYKLGQFLRKEYDSLLDDVYVPQDIDVRSTHTIRTIQSAQLVLAGLYPPTSMQRWHEELDWQPIPVFSRLKPEEDLLHPEICPKKLAYYNSLPSQSSIYQTFIKPYEKLYRFVEEKSGMRIGNPHDLLEFYFIVDTEQALGLNLPAWVHDVYPNKIYPVGSLTYSYLNMDNEIKKINSGYLMKKILSDAEDRRAGKRDSKKMYLYSGHESTLGYLLFSMDILKPHVPSYGSAIMIDLYKKADENKTEHFVKIKYRDSPVSTVAMDLVLPGCGGRTYCPLKKFAELQSHYIPSVSIEEACKLDKPDD